MTPHYGKARSQVAGGQLRINWVELSMPVLCQVRERFAAGRPLRGLNLASMGVRIDDLTTQQQEYLASWTHGT